VELPGSPGPEERRRTEEPTAASGDGPPPTPPPLAHGHTLPTAGPTPAGDASGDGPRPAPLPPAAYGDDLAAVEATPPGAAGEVSWVYRQGDAVWVYRGPGNAAPEAAAAQVARLLAAIRATPPVGDAAASSAAPAASPGFRWTWLLVGALSGLFVGVVLTYFLTRPVGSVDPTSLIGFGGVLLGAVGLRTSPLPRGDPSRRIAVAFLVGLGVYTLIWFSIGDPALEGLQPTTINILAPLSHVLSLAWVILGVKWLYDALGTTIAEELGPFGTVFTGMIASTLALLFFLRGAGQALAGADLDTLVTTVVALIVSAITAALIGPLLLGRQARRLSRPMILALCALLAITAVQFFADLAGSVTGALSGAAQDPAAAYQALEQSPRGWVLLGVYQVVVYLWGLAILILALGGPPVQPRPAAPAVEADVTVGDLILRWK
jgi:hypothetical protein